MGKTARIFAFSGGVCAIIATAAFVLRGTGGPPRGGGRPADGLVEQVAAVDSLFRERNYREARDRLRPLLEAEPDDPRLHFFMGRCRMELNADESAVPHLRVAVAHPEYREAARFWLGRALFRMDRVAEALPLLEKPIEQQEGEVLRKFAMAEILLDLEQYDAALQQMEGMPPGTSVAWARHRALSYLGRNEEAEREVESLGARAASDPDARATQAQLRSAMLREAGNFEGALKILEAASALVEAGTPPSRKLKRAELSVHLESGDAARLEAGAAELASAAEIHFRGAGLWYRAVAALLAGRTEEARKAAREFLEGVDREFTPLRLERLMLRRLVGEATDANLEAEARCIPRFRANDLYLWLALVTGDRAWAEKGLAMTPGRNVPYHALRRLLGK